METFLKKPKEAKMTDENLGCPCVALNAERIASWGGHRGGQDISFTQGDSTNPGATNFCTAPAYWDSTRFIIPVGGIYYTSINFVREYDHPFSGNFAIQLIRNNNTSSPIGSALAAANKDQDGQTGHYNLVTRFEVNDELKLRTWSGDPEKLAQIRSISWSLFRLCCDPGIAIPDRC
jgi:hypothetical protein